MVLRKNATHSGYMGRHPYVHAYTDRDGGRGGSVDWCRESRTEHLIERDKCMESSHGRVRGTHFLEFSDLQVDVTGHMVGGRLSGRLVFDRKMYGRHRKLIETCRLTYFQFLILNKMLGIFYLNSHFSQMLLFQSTDFFHRNFEFLISLNKMS